MSRMRPADPVRTLALAQFTNSLGDGAYYVTSVLYFTTVIGLSPTQVGLGLSCAWGLGFLAATPLGHAADRLGLRGTAVTMALTTAVGLCLLLVVRSFAGFILAASIYAVAQSGLAAVRQALLVPLVSTADRIRARGRIQVMLNAGVGLGAALGGLALAAQASTAYVIVLAADVAAFAVAALMMSRLPGVNRAPSASWHSSLDVLHDWPFVTATVLNAVLYFFMPVLSVLIPLWVADRTAAPHWVIGALLVINAVGVVSMQGRVARRVTNLQTAGRSITCGGVLLGASCLAFLSSSFTDDVARAAALLLLGGIVLVTGEVFLAAGSWEVGYALADPDRPGQWQGFYSSGIPVARAVGPLALLTLVMNWSVPGWIVLGGMFVASGLALGWLARAGGRRESEPIIQLEE